MIKFCTVCEDLISPNRLRAVPGATRCVSCQSGYDLDPREAFSASTLQSVSVEMAEGDGEHRMAGGDGSTYLRREQR